jgi:hypothetical protein
MPLSNGEKWISLLRAYGPTSENHAQHAEHVDRLAERLAISKLAFTHPASHLLAECFPFATGEFRNVVLTGTAGDGKTSLCLELVRTLTGHLADATRGVQEFSVETASGSRTLTFIYDVTAWKKKSSGLLTLDHVAVLERMAKSVFENRPEWFVLAVNDGQMHELFRALPEDAPAIVRKLADDLIQHHARREQDPGNRLRIINLSMIRSEKIMALCLDAILARPEWHCFAEEQGNPLFSESSSLYRNYHALKSDSVRSKLLMLARIADAADHHLPIRGTLCLLVNGLLGHPDARDRLVRPGAEAATLLESRSAHKAPLHKTLFGENLTLGARQKREVFRFLSLLRIGEETTNDLDDVLVFGARDEELKQIHADLVTDDPFLQRDPSFDTSLRAYIRGEITDEDDTNTFLQQLAAERRRVFLHATPAQMQNYTLWRTTVFHHAREYLDEILKPLDDGRSVMRLHLRKLATGLNRTWTGLLLAENASAVQVAVGLDLTTSPVSDIHLAQLDLDGDPPGLQISRTGPNWIPDALLSAGNRRFGFALTLPRFEFLCRVADGAMPSSFSRESCADFMSLKQRCLRDLQLQASTRSLQLIEVQSSGTIHKLSIHLAEQ